jgi:hypothetical protein
MSKKSEAMQAFISIYDKSRKPPKEQETVKSFLKELNKIKNKQNGNNP